MPGTISLSINPEGMDELLRRLDPARIPAAVRAMVSGVARLLLRYSQLDSPVRSGTLRRAGFMQIEDDGQSAIVAYGVNYAGPVEGGTQAHDIFARNAATLAFIPSSFNSLAAATAAVTARRATGAVAKGAVAQGLAVFPTHVFHPGTLANPFLARGWEDAHDETATLISEVGQRLLGGQDQVVE